MSKKSNLPDDAKTYTERGVAKLNLRDYRGAVADYSRAIALEPENAAAYGNRGRAKLRRALPPTTCTGGLPSPSWATTPAPRRTASEPLNSILRSGDADSEPDQSAGREWLVYV